ncbi:MAG: hypothetical protein HZC40_18730 [Chloroflexi bacterium]|nr:hypothetical protein [Chloroflexota bacterium]
MKRFLLFGLFLFFLLSSDFTVVKVQARLCEAEDDCIDMGSPPGGGCTTYCDGGEKEYPEPVSGNGGPPPDIGNLIQNTQDAGGIYKCGENCEATCVPVVTCDTLIINDGGVVTTWVSNTAGGFGGGDPDPSDSCTPTLVSYGFNCPTTIGNCTNSPCNDVFQCTRVCCPAAIAPAKPTLAAPGNGSPILNNFPDLEVTPFTNVSQWGLAPTNGANANCANNYNVMYWYLDKAIAKVNAATGGLGADVQGRCEQVANPFGSNNLPKWNCTITGGAEFNTTYYWKAQACNGSLCTSSDVWSFTTSPLSGWWQSQMSANSERA